MASFEDLVDDWTDDSDEESDYHLEPSSKVYVTGSDWTVGTLLNQFQQGNLDVSPAFQRRRVWDDRRSSRFVESLFMGLPIPQLVLAEDPHRPGSFIVLDGKQRLLTLAAFAKGSSFLSDSATSLPVLRLRGLEILDDLNGRTLLELEGAGKFNDRIRAFQNRTIRTVVINGWTDEDYLNLVFRRLNSGSVPLSTQELRQALHGGPFTDLLNEYTARSLPLQRALGLKGPDFRMRDIELALRFVAFDLRIERYSGNLKQFLDSAIIELNAAWDREEDRVVESLNALDASIDLNEKIFGEDQVFRRFVDGKYERRFNRAVFDVQALVLARRPLAKAAAKNIDAVRGAFETLSVADDGFAGALVSTTKSISATYERLSKWASAIEQVLGIGYPNPTLVENRIIWDR